MHFIIIISFFDLFDRTWPEKIILDATIQIEKIVILILQVKEVQFADDIKEKDKGKRIPGKYESLSLSYGNRCAKNVLDM